MNGRHWILSMVGAAFALSLVAAPVSAATSSDAALSETVRQLQAEIDALRSENQSIRDANHAIDQKLTRMEAESGETWLNERRAEEVKALIHEVLADADTRASLMADGMTAGHNGKKFFLASADGSFLLQIAGQIQVRYIYNEQDDSSDDGEFGMQIRRTKIGFSGHIASPKIKYAVKLAVSRKDNSVSAEQIVIGYNLTDELYIWAGEDKAPFLREELTSSSAQLAVERSAVNEFFTADKVQGVGLTWSGDMFRVAAMINDGARSGDGSGTGVLPLGLSPSPSSKDFKDDATDFAFSGRVDVLIMGDWKQMKDFTSWSGEEMAVFLGGGIHYQAGETGSSAADDNVILWTVDGSLEVDGLNIFAAYIGASTDKDSGLDADPWGIVIQGGYNIPLSNGESIEPFVRWEHMDLDDLTSGDEEIDILTIGANYYFKKHAAKLTVDAVIAFDPLVSAFDVSSGLGLRTDSGTSDDQFAIRAQFQLLW